MSFMPFDPRKIFRRLRGESHIGYVVLIGLIAFGAIAAVKLTGEGVKQILNRTGDYVSEAAAGGNGSGNGSGSGGGSDPSNEAPVWVTPAGALAGGTVGQPYSVTVAANDPEGETVTYAIGGGALPSGLALDPAGEISGTPSVGGVANVTIRATDPKNASADRAFSIDINTPPVWLTAAGTLPPFNEGVFYSYQLQAVDADNHDLTFTDDGGLPAGLSLSASGLISGTSSDVNPHTFTVTVTDERGASVPRTFTLGANAAPSFPDTTTSLPMASLNEEYSTEIQATDEEEADVVYAHVAGTLPPGLTFNADGTLTGTPTTAGTWTFSVQATDPHGLTDTGSFSLKVNAAPIWATASEAPMAHVGVSYTFDTEGATDANGDGITYELVSGAYPPGLSFSSISKSITGVPTTAGSYTFTIAAKDTHGASTEKTFSIEVNTPPVWLTSEGELPGILALNEAMAPIQLDASDADASDEITFALASGSSLPDGLSLSADGEISGTPTEPGVHSFAVEATDGKRTVQRSFALRVNTTPQWTTAAGAISASYSVDQDGGTFQFVAADPDVTDGKQTLTYTLTDGALPDGLDLSETGALSGTPTEAGTFNFDVTVSDGIVSVSRSFSLTVSAGGCSAGSTTYTQTGLEFEYAVPDGCTTLTVKMWGAGGGYGLSSGGPGGGGGYATATLTVTPGEILKVRVGGAGANASGHNTTSLGGYNGGGNGPAHASAYLGPGGGGGGASGVYRGATPLLMAGGGGGSGGSGGGATGAAGGAGGGMTGQAGYASSGTVSGGGGGTQDAGGARGTPGPTPATAGTYGQGGNGAQTRGYGGGGGGGGGYYGGGGGGNQGNNSNSGGGGGGGGGSGFGPENAILVAGTNNIPGNAEDPDRGDAGEGGTASTAATNGRVIIIPQ